MKLARFVFIAPASGASSCWRRSTGRGRISATDVQPLLPDPVLGILFVIAFAKTRTSNDIDR